MKVITIATDPENAFLCRLLGPSCDRVGLELIVLRPDPGEFVFADKRSILARCLPQVAGRDELVLFTDAYDTLFVRGEQHIRDAFGRFREPVVFSAELNSWPLGVIGFALYGGPPAGRYPYLNSGGFIGLAGNLLDLCHRYPAPPSDRFALLAQLRAHGVDTDWQFGWSDQYYWTLVRLLEPGSVGLDHDAELFECFGPPIPNVVLREVKREQEQFRALGRESRPYQRERERLRERLRQPSGAAQIHFNSAISKAVLLDLIEEGDVPAWIGDAAPAAAPVPVRPV